MNKVRTTVVLPETTAAKLRDRVPPRKRSEFVTEAIESHLMQLAFQTERERERVPSGPGVTRTTLTCRTRRT